MLLVEYRKVSIFYININFKGNLEKRNHFLEKKNINKNNIYMRNLKKMGIL